MLQFENSEEIDRSTKGQYVKIQFKDTNETYLVPMKLENLCYQELKVFIESKAKNLNFASLKLETIINEVSRTIINDQDIQLSKELLLGSKETFLKIFITQDLKLIVTIPKEDIDEQLVQKSESWNTICEFCRTEGIIGDKYQCLLCESVNICSTCEAKNFHSEHPLIKLKNQEQQNLYTNFKQGRISKIYQSIKNSVSSPLQKIASKPAPGIFQRLFGSNEEPKTVSDLETIVKINNLAQLFDTEPEHFANFVESHPHLNEEQMVQELLKHPKKYVIGL